MSELNDFEENATKIFLNAYTDEPQETVIGGFTKAQVRAYRARILEQCEIQRATNPVATEVMRNISGISLAQISELMLTMKRLHDKYEADYQKRVNSSSTPG